MKKEYKNKKELKILILIFFVFIILNLYYANAQTTNYIFPSNFVEGCLKPQCVQSKDTSNNLVNNCMLTITPKSSTCSKCNNDCECLKCSDIEPLLKPIPQNPVPPPSDSDLNKCDLTAIENFISYVSENARDRITLEKVNLIIDRCFGQNGELLRTYSGNSLCKAESLFIKLKKLIGIIYNDIAMNIRIFDSSKDTVDIALGLEDLRNTYFQNSINSQSYLLTYKPLCSENLPSCSQIQISIANVYKNWRDFWSAYVPILNKLVEDYNNAVKYISGNLGTPISTPDDEKRAIIQSQINDVNARIKFRLEKLNDYFSKLNEANNCPSNDPNKNKVKNNILYAQNQYLQEMINVLSKGISNLEEFWSTNFCEIDPSYSCSSTYWCNFKSNVYNAPRQCETVQNLIGGVGATEGNNIRNRREALRPYVASLTIMQMIVSSGVSIQDYNRASESEKLVMIFNAMKKKSSEVSLTIGPMCFKCKLSYISELTVEDIKNCENNPSSKSTKCMALVILKIYSNSLNQLFGSHVGQFNPLTSDIDRIIGNGQLTTKNKDPKNNMFQLPVPPRFFPGINGQLGVENRRPYVPFSSEELFDLNNRLQNTIPSRAREAIALIGLAAGIGGVASGSISACGFIGSLAVGVPVGGAIYYTVDRLGYDPIVADVVTILSFSCGSRIVKYVAGNGARMAVVESMASSDLEAAATKLQTKLSQKYTPADGYAVEKNGGGGTWTVTVRKNGLPVDETVITDNPNAPRPISATQDNTLAAQQLAENSQCRNCLGITNEEGIPSITLSKQCIQSNPSAGFNLENMPKYKNNVADGEIFSQIGLETGEIIENYFAARGYFAKKYIFNRGNAIKNWKTIIDELCKRKNFENKKFIWVIDNKGNLYIAEVPPVGKPELTHGILAYGQEVYGAGEIKFSGTTNNLQVTANTKTGHYFPRADSLRTLKQFNQDALKSLCDYFNVKLMQLILSFTKHF